MKAERQLQKTIEANRQAEAVAKRKQDDFEAKQKWLQEKNDALLRQREHNMKLREERK